jgi:hypothetical protein
MPSAWQADYYINTAPDRVDTIQDIDQMRKVMRAVEASQRPGLGKSNTKLVTFNNLVLLVVKLLTVLK